MKTILVTNQKGGTGKSTIAINLAQSLKSFCRTSILDLDKQGSLTTVHSRNLMEGVQEWQSDLESDILVVDTPPYLSHTLKDWIIKADVIVLPVKPSFLDIMATKSTFQMISDLKKEKAILVVPNLVNASTSITKTIAEHIQDMGYPVSKTAITERVSFTRSVLQENGIYGSGDKKAIAEFENLCKEILVKIQSN
jgi:chromosome partitioning protein